MIVLQSEDSDHPDLNTIQAVADCLYGIKMLDGDDDDDEEDRGRDVMRVKSFRERKSPPRVVSTLNIAEESVTPRSSSVNRLQNLFSKRLKTKDKVKLRGRRQSCI